MHLGLDVLRAVLLLEQPLCRRARESPPVAPVAHVLAADLADAGYGGEDHAARLERHARPAHGRAHVVDERQRLREDDAVVCALRDALARGQVAHDCRLRVTRGRVQHVGLFNARAEPVGIGALLHLQDPSPDQLLVLLEEALYVEPVDRPAAVQSELRRDGLLYPQPDAPALTCKAAERRHRGQPSVRAYASRMPSAIAPTSLRRSRTRSSVSSPCCASPATEIRTSSPRIVCRDTTAWSICA